MYAIPPGIRLVSVVGCSFPEGATTATQPCSSHSEMSCPLNGQECGQTDIPAVPEVAAHQQELCSATSQLRHQRRGVLCCVDTAEPDSAAALCCEL